MNDERPATGRKGKEKVRLFVVIGAIVSLVAVATGVFFWAGGSDDARHAYAMAPESALPDTARKAPPKVREAYRFATVNRGILSQIPCYCGCGAEHKSDADCFIREVRPDGSIVFDGMSLGCGICIDIARDVMRLLDEGKPLTDIRAYVDTTYSRFGPSTPTPPVR
jgi:nitrogen fixation-related uncharacterized protein